MNDKVIVVGGHTSLTTLCKLAVQHRPAPLGYVVTDQHGDRGAVVDVVYGSEKKRPACISLAGLFGLEKKAVNVCVVADDDLPPSAQEITVSMSEVIAIFDNK